MTDDKQVLTCNFCGKKRDEVEKLIAGPKVYICDECVKLSYDIVKEELDYFSNVRATIAGHAIFPARRINNKMTINGARGVNHKIQDRFDLTLECIRRFYKQEDSPLKEVFERYAEFFYLFQDFRGYVDFFLYQDLVSKDYNSIKFWHPFDDFKTSPLPTNKEEYMSYKDKVIVFLNGRNQRILYSTTKGE